MLRCPAWICFGLVVAFALGCKSKEAAAPEQRVGKIVIEGPKPGDLPAPPDVAAAPENAERTESGVACIVLREGSGKEHPAIYDKVTMHQVVWTTDGRMVMSTGNRPDPVEFPVTQSVLPGLREAIELMVEGEKRRCWIPGRLAFGEAAEGEPQRGIRPRGTLVYELDLLKLKKAVGLPEAPPDVGAVPDDAQRSESGLAWRVLKEGTGDKHPGPNSLVSLYYTGWTPEGKVFMTTAGRGAPKGTHMRSTIPGWFEGLQMMKQGEKRRFWIPAELAYRGQPGWPPGMVVFDLELVAISP
jgi:FKBP-type peptidyl-prolyl cis-trans isomerase